MMHGQKNIKLSYFLLCRQQCHFSCIAPYMVRCSYGQSFLGLQFIPRGDHSLFPL